MSNFKKVQDLLKTQANESVKEFVAYDTLGRMEYHYVTASSAEHGDPCSVTQYAYDGSSSRVVYRKEYLGTWDSSWEVF